MWHDHICGFGFVFCGFGKIVINAHNSWLSDSNLIKIIVSYQNLSNDIDFAWFRRGPHFSIVSIVFSNYVISNHMTFKSAYFVDL